MRFSALCFGLVCIPMAVAQGANGIQFRDATGSSGVKFIHSDGSSGERYIVETVTAGLGLIDFDADGFLDIFFLTGAPLPRTSKGAPAPSNALYRNNRDGTFTDVTRPAGVGLPAYAMGCAVADYDNDGFEDIFVTNFGPPRLLRNTGKGSFEDVTEKAGLALATPANVIGAGCAFFDYDRDGLLDLYVGNYLQFDLTDFKPCVRVNVPVYCNPRNYPAVASRLYRNNGNGTFSDASESSSIGKSKGYAMGVVCADFDGDGWTDLFVGNDVLENFLFRNRGNGVFEEIGLVAGAAYDQYGDPQGTMGANVGDYDGDGRFDIIVTDYQDQVNTLYRNLGVHGVLQFQDVTVPTGVGANSRPLVTWGCGFVDFDNDGVKELFTAAGHLQDTIEQHDNASTYKQRNLLFTQRDGRFVDISAKSGAAMLVKESSRGAVFGDLNNDGKQDIVVLNARSRPTLMINETAARNHWAILKLVGTKSNRSAVGAAVTVKAGRRAQVDEVRSGRGYQSAEDLRLHFGLGTNTTIDRLEIRWPSGLTNTWTNLSADRVIRLTEH